MSTSPLLLYGVLGVLAVALGAYVVALYNSLIEVRNNIGKAQSQRSARARRGFLATPMLKRRVFLLSDSPEVTLRGVLGKSLLESFACRVFVFVAGLWLVLTVIASFGG